LDILDDVLLNDPVSIRGLRLRVALLVRMGRYHDAIGDLDRLLDIEPDRAEFHYERAVANLYMNHERRAMEGFTRCLALDPAFASAYAARAGIHVRSGNHQAALVDINQALQIRPGDLSDLHNRAVVFTALEQYDSAIRDYREVIAADPHNAGSYNNLAWLLATADDPAVRDGEKALAYAKEAVKRGDSPAWLDTLATAYAECGDFPRAVATAEEAYRKSSPPVERFHQRIEIYRRSQTLAAWREERTKHRKENPMTTKGLIGHDLFKFLRPDQVSIISDVAERISLKAGDTVFRQGEDADYFFIVLDGQVALRLPGHDKVSILIDEVMPGDVFGSCVCFQLGSYSLTARCVEDSRLMKIKASSLKRVMEDDTAVGFAVQTLISRVYFQRYVDTMHKLQAILGNMPLQVD
jgi:Flp pilus assembly protein TadD